MVGASECEQEMAETTEGVRDLKMPFYCCVGLAMSGGVVVSVGVAT